MRKQLAQCYNTSLLTKSKVAKFLTTFFYLIIMTLHFLRYFFVFCNSIFSKAPLKASFSLLMMAAFRKLAGKIMLGSISPARTHQGFLDTNFHSHMGCSIKMTTDSIIVSHRLARPFTRLMQENCAKNLMV